jgi:DNA-binding GntR family transcriptional regulator
MAEARMGSQAFAPKVARHAVRNHIARQIAVGEYRPGMKLVQEVIAKETGVSRGVVREAIFELQGMGLVEAVDNRGAMVNEFNMDRLLESYELREVLEGLAARRCCSRITVQQMRELRAQTTEIHRLYADGKHEEGGCLDRDFHLRLIEIGGNRLVERLSNTYAVLAKMITVPTRDLERLQREHQGILDEIEAGNPQRAEECARLHVRNAAETVRNHAGKLPNFQWLTNASDVT